MDTSEAVAVLCGADLSQGQLDSLEQTISRMERPNNVANALSVLSESKAMSDADLELLKSRVKEEKRKKAAVAVGDVILPEVEDRLVNLLHRAKGLLDARKEPWVQELHFSVRVRAKVKYSSPFNELYAHAKDGSILFGGDLGDEISTDDWEIMVHGPPGADKDMIDQIKDRVNNVITDKDFADRVVREVHEVHAAIDTIIGDLNSKGLKEEDIFAYLESRHECLPPK